MSKVIDARRRFVRPYSLAEKLALQIMGEISLRQSGGRKLRIKMPPKPDGKA